MTKKKIGENSKAVEARERKEASKKEAASKAAKAAEDEYWQQAGEGSKSKAQQKKDEQERKKQEAAQKKAETKQLAEQEEAEMGAKKSKTKPQKVTKYQLDVQKEVDKRESDQKRLQQQREQRREVSEEDYQKMVDVENINRQGDEGDIVASGIQSAVDQIAQSSKSGGEEDMHPERRMKAAWKAFYERELPMVKEEKPGLRLPQYREMIYKKWQKSPENPMVV
eukprot:TRINITY_DN17033_c0_g2_i1.p2 TRINITY_DN17033_c0_g2~~TRINITY_DN17033_c0_g2_i1.p2  ORF type:complete len:224 (+),score=60.76 TRINITY_DN17033_c0_g2_i1:37-708(+)